MHIREYFEKIKKWLAADELEIVYKLLAVITAMCLVFSYALTVSRDKKEKEYEIVVHIKGEVVNPGVYTVNSKSRMDDLIKAAGGFTEDADIEDINLAERVVDGEVVFIPRKVDSKNTNLININTADEQMLDKLDGVGTAMAKRIIEYRNKYGSFKRIQHIMNVDGIGEKQFEKIKNMITV